MKLNDDRVGDRFYFYHTTKSLNAYSHFTSGSWRTSRGYYGKGVYGFNSPPPSYGGYGDICFRFHCLRPHRIFFADVSLGKTFLAGYSVNMGLDILDDHDVPDKYINGSGSSRYNKGLNQVLQGENINSSVLFVDDGSQTCFLSNYDFDGMAYKSHDGYAMLFWNFSPALLRITGVKKTSDSTFKDIPVGATQQEVEDIFNGVSPKKKTTTMSSSIPVRKYASASLIKYVSAYPNQKARFEVLIHQLLSGSNISTEQMIFIESWYIRFNLTPRRSVYGGLVHSYTYNNVIVPAAVIMANATVASASPVDPSDVGSKADFGRLNKYMIKYSLNNHLSRSVWEGVTQILGFKATDVISIIPEIGKIGKFQAMCCLHGLVESKLPSVSAYA